SKSKHDGVIIRNIREGLIFELTDDFVIFKPLQVKSQLNNGAFSNEHKEIYKQSATDRDIDRRYFDALNAGDMDTARSIVDEQARRKGYYADNQHRMLHQPPNSHDGYPNLANVMNSDLVPADYWTHPQFYLYSPEEWDAYRSVLYALRNKKLLTVYRAVPADVKETALRNGDWVTPSRDYAVQHGESSLDGNYRIISAKVSAKSLWWDGNSIAELGYDDGKDYAYRNTKNGRKLNDTVVHEYTGGKLKKDAEGHYMRDDNGRLIWEQEPEKIIVPPSKRFNYRKPEEYHQTVQRFTPDETFSDRDTEAAFIDALTPQEQESTLDGLKHSLADILHGFKGDFPELAGQEAKAKGLTHAREILRIMNRNSGAKAHEALMSFRSSLKDLNPQQFNIFSRIMLINDIYTFRRNNPNAALPLGFTHETLKASKEKFIALAQRDKAILQAIKREYSINESIRKELAELADELGLKTAAEREKQNGRDPHTCESPSNLLLCAVDNNSSLDTRYYVSGVIIACALEKIKEARINMSDEVKSYDFMGHRVRVMNRNGEAWFAAKDVCAALGLANPFQVVKVLDEDERINLQIMEKNSNGRGRPANLLLVSEPGMYELVFRSRKPQAKAFSRWVRHEVLPAIRKNGTYIAPDIKSNDTAAVQIQTKAGISATVTVTLSGNLSELENILRTLIK
ncbi:MAG: hypothetical protein IJQ08_01460, partial [Synergistaceae bacterium]|nr:hypothetical protein [Synergistaceae bacterium]